MVQQQQQQLGSLARCMLIEVAKARLLHQIAAAVAAAAAASWG
jgi:hypothetical protein